MSKRDMGEEGRVERRIAPGPGRLDGKGGERGRGCTRERDEERGLRRGGEDRTIGRKVGRRKASIFNCQRGWVLRDVEWIGEKDSRGENKGGRRRRMGRVMFNELSLGQHRESRERADGRKGEPVEGGRHPLP